MPEILTTGAVADRFGLPIWQVRQLVDRGVIPHRGRVGRYRMIAADDLPAIEVALRKGGFLREPQPTCA